MGFDLPAARPHFEDDVASFGLHDRLRFQSGDFLADPLPAADVLVMGHILHDWSLEQKRTLLAHAHATLPPGGALIAFDTMIDDDRRRNAFGLLMSLNMLIETPRRLRLHGGRLPRSAGGDSCFLERSSPDAPLAAPARC
jgi:hypothetical protein